MDVREQLRKDFGVYLKPLFRTSCDLVSCSPSNATLKCYTLSKTFENAVKHKAN